jgi:hypothetical protein
VIIFFFFIDDITYKYGGTLKIVNFFLSNHLSDEIAGLLMLLILKKIKIDKRLFFGTVLASNLSFSFFERSKQLEFFLVKIKQLELLYFKFILSSLYKFHVNQSR